jgi:hypothetical protein
LKLADKYSIPRLESACKKALHYTPSPSLKSVQTILKTSADKTPEATEEQTSVDESQSYAFTRGASYYGRK